MNDSSRSKDTESPPHAGEPDGSGKSVAIILGRSDRRIWGLDPVERLRRSLARIGLTDCRHVDSTKVDMGDLPDRGKILLLRGDHIYEERLLKAMAGRSDLLLRVAKPQGGSRVAGAAVSAAQARWAAAYVAQAAEIVSHDLPAGIKALDPGEIASHFDNQLRKRAAPYVFNLHHDHPDDIERRMFAGAYKGVTDLVTKWVWPWPARHVTRWLAPTAVTPNMVTALSLAFVLLAMYCFAQGWFLWGVAAAWFMTFLDTVDGKLARVTLTSSKWGNVFDHGIDLIHPPFWWAAWYYGCLQVGTVVDGEVLLLALWVNILGYVLGRLEEGFFIWRFGIELHAWRRVDSRFRLVTARRNPNLLLLSAGAVLGYPGAAFVGVAVWTVISLLFHAARIAQALSLSGRGAAVNSWLSEPRDRAQT